MRLAIERLTSGFVWPLWEMMSVEYKTFGIIGILLRNAFSILLIQLIFAQYVFGMFENPITEFSTLDISVNINESAKLLFKFEAKKTG